MTNYLNETIMSALQQSNKLVSLSVSPTRRKERTALQIAYRKTKLFVWHLHPMHWFDGMIDFKFGLEELMPKKKLKD
jgi:hypothetical protein